MLYAERAVAVVFDDGLDGVGLAVVSDPVAGVARDLAQRVGVRSGLGVLDGAHRDLAVVGILAGGDDLGALALALDELEGELALLEVAASQDLGRGDLVGDAGARRRQVVGILELGGLGALQLVRSGERTVTVIGDGGHDGIGLAVVRDAVAGGSTVDLAQRIGVLARRGVFDGTHRDLAASVVGAGGDNIVTLDELEGELAFLEVAPGQDLGRGDLIGDAEALGSQIVNVLELDALNVLGALQLVRSHQLALAVIADGRHDGVDRVVVGNTAGVALNLVQRIGVLTDLVVLDGAERHVAIGVTLDGLDKLRVLTLDLAQLKAELAFRKGATSQVLRHVNLIGDTGLNGLRSVGVLELGLARGHLHGSAQHARLVGRHRHGDLRNIVAVGDAVDRGPGMLLANLVDIRAGLGVGDLTEIDSRVALGRSRDRGRGHRGTVLGRQAKLKLVLIRPLATLEHLGQAKAGLGIHRCRRHVVLIADLAVVAQVNVNLRGVRLGRRVVPLGIEHVGRGAGEVTAHALLGGVELINKGQACGSLAKRQVSTRIGHDSVLKARGVSAGKLDNSSAGFGLTVCALCLKLVLVVIDVVGSQRILRRLRAILVHINGSLLLEIVIAVGVGRLKVCDRIAQRASVPLVRVEVHGLGTVLRGDRIALDVALEPRYLLGRKQVVECVSLNARGVVHLDGLSIVDRKNAIGDLKVAQRNQRRRNLNRYDIAGPGLALFGMLNGNDQVCSRASIFVGVDVALGLYCRVGKRLAVVHDRRKVVDLHKVAQLVSKRNVARLMLAITAVNFGRVTSLDNASRDLFEDFFKLSGTGCRLVVAGIGNGVAEINAPVNGSKKAIANGR